LITPPLIQAKYQIDWGNNWIISLNKQTIYKQQGLKLDVAQATEGSNDDISKQQSIYILTIFHILGKI